MPTPILFFLLTPTNQPTHSKMSDDTESLITVYHKTYNFCEDEIRIGTVRGVRGFKSEGELRLRSLGSGDQSIGSLCLGKWNDDESLYVNVTRPLSCINELDPRTVGYSRYASILRPNKEEKEKEDDNDSSEEKWIDVHHLIVSSPDVASLVAKEIDNCSKNCTFFVYTPATGPGQCTYFNSGQINCFNTLNLHNCHTLWGWWKDFSKYEVVDRFF